MTVFLEVLKDLWSFVLDIITPQQKPAIEQKQLYLPIITPEAPVKSTSAVVEVIEPKMTLISGGGQGEKAYVIVSEAKVFQRPVWAYDSVIFKLNYTDDVHIIEYSGRFAHIMLADKYGWVLKDEISTNAVDIFPVFQNGEIYSSNHPDTKKVRLIIKDEFFTEKLYIPLQAVEFIIYCLNLDKRKISWSLERPRLAGNWQNLLKGKKGVHIGIFPKAGAIIEYYKPDGSGWVGYTKSVHVDDSIVILGVGRLIEGEYREEQISKDQWHEWRPVWISLT